MRRASTWDVPWQVVPSALKTDGRLGRTALLHLRKLARRQTQHLDEGACEAASALLLRCGCRLSVALKRASAKASRAALGNEAAGQTCRRELASQLLG